MRARMDDSRPIWQTIGLFLIPLMLSNILQSLSATANSIYIGRVIGVSALAAISAFFPLLFFMISFFIGIASGSTVLIGQAYGAGNTRRLKQVAGTTLGLTIVVGVVAGAAGAIFVHPLLSAIGTPSDIIAKLNAAMVQALTDPVVKKRFADLGLDIAPRAQQTPEGLAAFQKAEMAKWWPIIKDAGIRGD